MKALIRFGFIAGTILAVLGLIRPLAAQDKPSPDKIVGAWALEVNAGGENYYLTLELKLVDGQLAGGLGEQSGMFTNVPLTAIEWDGGTLKFNVKIPTPPDGQERLTKCSMEYKDGKLAGSITIEDLGLSAPVTGTKK
jgi:hypothetical protein